MTSRLKVSILVASIGRLTDVIIGKTGVGKAAVCRQFPFGAAVLLVIPVTTTLNVMIGTQRIANLLLLMANGRLPLGLYISYKRQ